MFDEKKVSTTCPLQFIKSNGSGDIEMPSCQLALKNMLYACSCCAGRLHQGGIEADCHLCRRLILCCVKVWNQQTLKPGAKT